MNIDYSKLMTYDYFLKNYSSIINSELYKFIEEKADYLCRKLKNTCLNDPKERIKYLDGELREEKNIYYKHLVINKCIFDEDLFYTILDRNNTNITDFISEIAKIITLSRITKNNLNGKDKKVSKILNTISDYHCVKNIQLIILKLYEIEYKNSLKLEKHK